MKEEMRNFFRSKPAKVRELSSKQREVSSKQLERKSAFVRLARMLGRELINIARMWVLGKLPGARRSSPGVLGRQDIPSRGLPGARHSFPRDDLEPKRSLE